uniref:Odorant receptor n=1 Tax=Trichogramma kaykai TaxID=54128 RepID=A0ABD2XAS9_9HYME
MIKIDSVTQFRTRSGGYISRDLHGGISRQHDQHLSGWLLSDHGNFIISDLSEAILTLEAFFHFPDFERSEPIGIVTFLCLLIALIFNVFIFCYVGEILTEQCRLVGKDVYAVDWYELPAREARNFVLILAQSQRPIVLTAGKMFVLSMQNFANVMKASATYLHMLRTVTVNL